MHTSKIQIQIQMQAFIGVDKQGNQLGNKSAIDIVVVNLYMKQFKNLKRVDIC